MAAITRHWSTFLNGIQTDETKFRGEIAKIVAHVKASAGKAPAGKPIAVVDGDSALAAGDADPRLRARVPAAVPGRGPRRCMAPDAATCS